MKQSFRRSSLSSRSRALLLGLIASVSTALVAETHAAVGDPLLTLYLFPGVVDSGGAAFGGNATAVSCTNFSGVNETINFQVREFDGTLKANASTTIGQAVTITAATKDTGLLTENVLLNTGVVAQGALGVLATSRNMVCTAVVLQASITNPEGYNLHGLRFNPIPGTQE